VALPGATGPRSGWSRGRLKLTALCGLAGLVMSAGLIWSGAYAAFSANTANVTSTLSTGTWPSTALKWIGDGQYGQGGAFDFTLERSPGQESTGGMTWNVVAAGTRHTCATKTDGTLWCWGNNSCGQLGLGDYTLRSSPAQVPGATVTGVFSGSAANQTFYLG